MNEATQLDWKKIGPGYYELCLPTWSSFVDLICNDLLEHNSYIWRGHRCDDWKLESTFTRLMKNMGITGYKTIDPRRQLLEKFKFATRGRRGGNPATLLNENDWWALGQHHGLATPLLDWSTSPFVAAFFAFIQTDIAQTDYRVIFALHQPTLEGWSASKVDEESARRKERQKEIVAGTAKNVRLSDLVLNGPINPELVIVRPMSDENHRLLNQGGLFTRLNEEKALEEWVQENHPAANESLSLVKILIPNTERKTCLQTLNRMNINALTLFPDLEGASKYCNLQCELPNY